MAGTSVRAEDVELLNRLARGPAVPIAMDATGAAVLPIVSVTEALGHIAREGIELLTGPLRGRVRECVAHDCQLLFVDTSRPGRRQWCSMARCGNIAKTRAYRGKVRRDAPPNLVADGAGARTRVAAVSQIRSPGRPARTSRPLM